MEVGPGSQRRANLHPTRVRFLQTALRADPGAGNFLNQIGRSCGCRPGAQQRTAHFRPTCYSRKGRRRLHRCRHYWPWRSRDRCVSGTWNDGRRPESVVGRDVLSACMTLGAEHTPHSQRFSVSPINRFVHGDPFGMRSRHALPLSASSSPPSSPKPSGAYSGS